MKYKRKTNRIVCGKGYRKKENVELYKKGKWRCILCKKVKSRNEFRSDKTTWMGHDYKCYKCNQARMKVWAIKNLWKYKAVHINWRADLKFVSKEDLEQIWKQQKNRCYYCNKKLSMKIAKNIHFDHVINGINKISNLVMTCQRCNLLKSDATADELENIVRKIREHQRKCQL